MELRCVPVEAEHFTFAYCKNVKKLKLFYTTYLIFVLSQMWLEKKRTHTQIELVRRGKMHATREIPSNAIILGSSSLFTL